MKIVVYVILRDNIDKWNIRYHGKGIPPWRYGLKELVTIENLKTALQRSLENAGDQDEEWIDQIAQFVMDFFGFEERILDNRLTPRDRDIFYMLEGMGLLKTEMEEATIQKGKVWRIHYWILNREKISSLVKLPECEECQDDPMSEGRVYEHLSESQWERHN
jgi:hypothetical protein